MGRENRRGERKSREHRVSQRVPELGYYIIVADTEETEKNYLHGLRDAIPPCLRDKLVIKVFHAQTEDLIDRCKDLIGRDPQYRMPWIVFDRDRVPNFNQIIARAQQEGFHVGWSNPCIEIWFHAYFGRMPSVLDSVCCCESFAKKYKQLTGVEYDKTDPSILDKLRHYGDETKAIQVASRRMKQWEESGITKPTDMCPCTALFELVEEITSKTQSTAKRT